MCLCLCLCLFACSHFFLFVCVTTSARSLLTPAPRISVCHTISSKHKQNLTLGKNIVEAASENEMLLAELAFSPPQQLPRLVERNLDSLNEEFYSFLEAKIRISKNEDEKETLTLLKHAVTDLMQKILQAAMNRGDISVDDVKAAGLSAPAISTFSGADMAVLSYDKLIDEVS